MPNAEAGSGRVQPREATFWLPGAGLALEGVFLGHGIIEKQCAFCLGIGHVAESIDGPPQQMLSRLHRRVSCLRFRRAELFQGLDHGATVMPEGPVSRGSSCLLAIAQDERIAVDADHLRGRNHQCATLREMWLGCVARSVFIGSIEIRATPV